MIYLIFVSNIYYFPLRHVYQRWHCKQCRGAWQDNFNLALQSSPPREDPTTRSKMTKTHSKQTPYAHDFILGFADGLTVPFALTAGLSSLGNPKFVVTAGLAELFSGSISMGKPIHPKSFKLYRFFHLRRVQNLYDLY